MLGLRSSAFSPDIVDALNYSDVGENGQDPENGLHDVKQEARGEKDDAFRSLHQSNGALNLGGLCSCSGIRNERCPNAGERGQDDKLFISPFEVENNEREKNEGVGITVQDRVEKSSKGSNLVKISCHCTIKQIQESRENDSEAGSHPEVCNDQSRGSNRCKKTEQRQKVRISAIPCDSVVDSV